MTVQDLINRSLSLIGRLGAGRTAGATESARSFDVLNAMLASWSTNRLCVFTVQSAIHNLQAGLDNYQIGAGVSSPGFNTARPIKIVSANILASVAGAYTGRFPLRLIDQVEWSGISFEGDTSVIPRLLYNDRAYPTSALWLFPTPAVAVQIELFTWQALGAFAALTDAVAFPEGYERAIAYNLAMELAPLFELKIPDAVGEIAQTSKESIERLNAQMAPASDLPPQPAPANNNRQPGQ